MVEPVECGELQTVPTALPCVAVIHTETASLPARLDEWALQTELSHSQPAAWMAAAVNTGHSAFDLGKDKSTFESGRWQSIRGEMESKDCFHSGRTGTSDPSQSFGLPSSAMSSAAIADGRPRPANSRFRPYGDHWRTALTDIQAGDPLGHR